MVHFRLFMATRFDIETLKIIFEATSNRAELKRSPRGISEDFCKLASLMLGRSRAYARTHIHTETHARTHTQRYTVVRSAVKARGMRSVGEYRCASGTVYRIPRGVSHAGMRRPLAIESFGSIDRPRGEDEKLGEREKTRDARAKPRRPEVAHVRKYAHATYT